VTIAATTTQQIATEAYRTYVTHGLSCTACPVADFQCATAADLWQAYIEARG
jgi:hypothetical protein